MPRSQGEIRAAEICLSGVLYFARGRGRGHALAGLAIADRLAALCPGIETRFVSYGTGAETLREHGRQVLDLELPDQPGLFDIAARLPRAFTGATPALVVAHEEFDVPAAARKRGLPCVMVTDWFLDNPGDWRMESLQDVVEVLFLDDARVVSDGTFRAPDYAKERVTYVGPVLRPLRFQRSDRLRARQEAGLAPDALIVSVFIHPGRRSEAVAPLAAVLEPAVHLLETPRPKLLLWDRDGDPEFDRIMAASDIAITKGNRNIVLELATLGVPTISVSHGLNLIDDIRTAPLPNNRTVPHAGLTVEHLSRLMHELLSKDAAGEIQPVAFQDGARLAAERLALRLEKLLPGEAGAISRTPVPLAKTDSRATEPPPAARASSH